MGRHFESTQILNFLLEIGSFGLIKCQIFLENQGKNNFSRLSICISDCSNYFILLQITVSFTTFTLIVLFLFQMKFILFLLTVFVLLNQYMFARSLICDRITEDSRYFPCRSHDNTGFLDQFVPLPFIRSKKLEGHRKKFQSCQSLNILRLRPGSIERNPGPVQNHTGKACTISGELKSF